MDGGGKSPGRSPALALPLTPGQIEQFREKLLAQGLSADTVKSYLRTARQLYDYLDADKLIRQDTLRQWRASLLQSGLAVQTVNVKLAAANNLVASFGRREWRVELGDAGERAQPELTRKEYLRLLRAAGERGWARSYLLVKLFCITGIRLREAEQVTVEAARAGKLFSRSSGGGRVVVLPEFFRRELLEHARRSGVESGPVFVTRSGRPLQRTDVFALISRLSGPAQVEVEKCNVRCLQKLYQSTQESIRQNLSLLLEQAYERLLETEQFQAAWPDGAYGSGS